MALEYGETWAYESIIGAVPGVNLSPAAAIAIQFAGFELVMLALAWLYGTWSAVLAGTVAITLATVGSIEMLRISQLVRRADVSGSYRRALFGSSIEVVLSVMAFIALVTYLFVYDVRTAGDTLLVTLFGERPPVAVVWFTLLVLWDVCYRIGTGWWAAVVGLWRSVRFSVDETSAATLRRADGETFAFACLQLLLVPFVLDHPVLLAAIVGHVFAVGVVTSLSVVVLFRRSARR
jgi:hypothetical protein